MTPYPFATVAIVALGLGCGGVESLNGGMNAPCTRSSDCDGALLCSAGVCRDPSADAGHLTLDADSSVDASAEEEFEPDAGVDGG